MFVDLIAEVPDFITISQASALEAKIENTLKTARKEITEVRVTFRSPEPKINKQS
jgi:divalent metal cation (Fe/Co/Zn/Cd) transporter